MIDPISFARSPATVILEEDADNMSSDWKEYIVVTRSVKGLFNLFARKQIEEWTRGRYEDRIYTVFRVINLRTPARFIDGVLSCQRELGSDLNWDLVVRKLGLLDQEFAAKVNECVEKM